MISRLNVTDDCMWSKNKEVYYLNFTPTAHEELYVRKALDQIEAYAPSSSFLSISFTQMKGVIQARMTVNSFTKDFFAKAVGKDVAVLIERLNVDMIAQIRKWKKKRMFSGNGAWQTSRFDPPPDGGCGAIAIPA